MHKHGYKNLQNTSTSTSSQDGIDHQQTCECIQTHCAKCNPPSTGKNKKLIVKHRLRMLIIFCAEIF